MDSRRRRNEEDCSGVTYRDSSTSHCLLVSCGAHFLQSTMKKQGAVSCVGSTLLADERPKIHVLQRGGNGMGEGKETLERLFRLTLEATSWTVAQLSNIFLPALLTCVECIDLAPRSCS